MIEAVTATGAAKPAGPYSHGITVGDLLFCSGQAPQDPNGNRLGETFADQVRATMDNLEKICAEAGTSMKNAVKVTAYLSSLDYFEEYNAVYAEYLGTPPPARTTVPVDLRGFDVEIDAVVAIPKQ